MIGTVEEATRWDCPRSMDVYGYPGGNCRGDKCAAWRWLPSPKAEINRSDIAPKGYCGAFGRPEAE